MTTPQPNPTDDLEAVARIIWTRFMSRLGGDWYPSAKPTDSGAMRDTFAASEEILAALRPAGVGEAVAWRWRLRPGAMFGADVMDWSYGDKNPQISHPMWDVQPLYATPAHPDAALMERVRTVLGKARRYVADMPIVGDADLVEIDSLLSDLKAEAVTEPPAQGEPK